MTLEHFDDEFSEVERYELREAPVYRFQPNRRQAVQILGAGLVIAVSVRGTRAQPSRRGSGQGGRPDRVHERFHIGRDGVVTMMTSKVEAGQGSRTQLTQAAAEELHLPLSQIQLVMADTGAGPDDGGTAGSRTTPSTVPRVRAAAAAARELLVNLAAEKLQAERAQITFSEGKFVDGSSRKQLTLAQLVSDESFLPKLEQAPANASAPAVASVEQWKVLGTSVPKVNGHAVVTGASQFPSDVRRTDMLYGKVLRPPSLAAKLQSIDLAPAKAMEGVTVVHDGNFVACAAKTSWQAAQAVAALSKTAKWDSPSQPSSDELFAQLKRTASASGRGGSRETPTEDPVAALAKLTKKINTAYTVAYIQHAPMEPRAAVAEWTDGKLTVWTGTQQPSRVRDQLAETFRLRSDSVRVIVPDTGGGFGGKHTNEAAIEAARLAQAAGRPVSLRWTREEEFTWAYFRPAGLIEVRAGLDDAGQIAVWDFTNYNSGGSAIESPYRSAGGRTRFLGSNAPLRQGSYRALASTANTFAREAAIDELAALANVDPLQFRLTHLPEGRLKDVLQAVATRFDWKAKRAKPQAGRGVGIACGTEKASYVATCAEVEIRSREIHVLSVTTTYECGAIQNPDNLRSQVEGCLMMGLGGALFEEIQFKDGAITNGRFSDYRVPRMQDLPQLDIELLDRKDLASVGAGETPIIAIAPAIANAVAQATGQRLRSLPLKLA